MSWRPNYAEVMSTLAFFVAVGGVGWAAATINSADVVNESLRSKDLKDNKAVKSADVALNALTGEDIDEDSLDTIDADRLIGINGDVFARNSARRQSVSAGFSSQPVVTNDAAGAFQLLCNNPDAEDSKLRFFAPSPSVPGAGNRDSWVTLDGAAPGFETVLSDGADNHSINLAPGATDHRVVWADLSPAAASGEIVTATFSFHQSDTTNAQCEILGHAVVGFVG